MNKEIMFKQLKSKNGITLIALVVTIIVLIILAGVSISLVLGDNGIITKAKQGKENTELAKVEEEVQLNEAAEYLENMEVIKTVEEMKIAGTYMPAKTTLKDSNGNLIKVPEGFKKAHDSGINVTEGIVIEDNDIIEGVGNDRGNQYVWIPVGENIKKQNKKDGTIIEVDITLGRYMFADGTNHKDNKGTVLSRGTPMLIQNINEYTNQTDNMKINTYFFEDITQRDGIESSSTDGLNATALSILNFKTSVENNKGYYIARYEASFGEDGKANSKVSTGIPAESINVTKTEGMLWNCIAQTKAAIASRGLYKKITTDLINSYAWDTVIVYIQAFSEDSDYSYQNGNSINSSLANTGVNKDELCNINDMASNILEWTTEYCTRSDSTYAYPCTDRGGYHNNSIYYNACREYNAWTNGSEAYGFRYILYI